MKLKQRTGHDETMEINKSELICGRLVIKTFECWYKLMYVVTNWAQMTLKTFANYTENLVGDAQSDDERPWTYQKHIFAKQSVIVIGIFRHF